MEPIEVFVLMMCTAIIGFVAGLVLLDHKVNETANSQSYDNASHNQEQLGNEVSVLLFLINNFMTNIEKVKRIIDAGHWVKVTFEDGETTTITSCLGDEYTWIDDNGVGVGDIIAEGSIIEVIQRIPTAYKDGDKVLVLSNPDHYSDAKQEMVGKVLEIGLGNGINYVVSIDGKLWYHFPNHCLAPAFEEDSLSGKEAKVVIDGKEYSATLKLI